MMFDAFHLRSLAKDEHGDAVSETNPVRERCFLRRTSLRQGGFYKFVGSVEAGLLYVLGSDEISNYCFF